MTTPLLDILLLLGAAVFVVALLHRLHVPSILGYLVVGIALGPYTAGPVVEAQHIRVAAEFGIVFLLFTIGLNFSLPQIYALRHTVLGLGTGQVLLTTAAIGAIAWWCGLTPTAAFVVGAVFAQSSTTVISKQLGEQGEDQSRHGRMALAMSVFQDVTAVPFVVVLPVLASASAGASALAAPLAWALAKALAAFAIVFVAGRWLLRPLFHQIAGTRSAELFTLTVLFVSLVSAWTTSGLGLSMAFGAFLAGMMLGETEFRHQIESTIRPFRDVLLGLFFVTIGMLFDPAALPRIWPWALAGAAGLLSIKVLLVALLVRLAGIDAPTSWRTGIVLAVGGEFGFALLAIALGSRAISEEPAQIALTSVLLSMAAAPFLIRYNQALALRASGRAKPAGPDVPGPSLARTGALRDHVIICGYGRIGQNVGHLLEEEGLAYIALDLDPARVHEARLAGEPVYYGDSAERDILEAVGIGAARLVVISHDDRASALKVLGHVRALRPGLPIMVRTRDESGIEDLRRAGATEVVPETLEAGMMIASHALMLLDVPLSRVFRRMRALRADRYHLLREYFRGEGDGAFGSDEAAAGRLRPVVLPGGGRAVGRTLAEIGLGGDDVLVTALVRAGKRRIGPDRDTVLEGGDVVVLFGAAEDLQRAESRLLA